MAEQSKESSMEEILSSIKRIIAEDKAVDAGETASRPEAPPKPKLKAVPKAEPMVEVSEDGQAEEILELTNELPEEQITASQNSSSAHSLSAQSSSAQSSSAQGVFGDRRKKERLIDDNKLDAMRQSLSQLVTADKTARAAPATPTGETSLEELTRDLMRPMLKDWLDANLPGLVEELVAKEIRRLNEK
ncbi:hypothetical protein MNBD_ALPHA04-449 [hydrothermal vent metagenome]|uniref:Cell division organizing protein PopZ n=1 Tax=hydrothermal vent metagenome TaxID=652676 RepID=A0A3B0S1Q7_9ZZZZ